MSIEDNSIMIVEVDNYTAIALQEYKGKFGLVSLKRGQNDALYINWVFISKWSQAEGRSVPDKSKKNVPMAVRLGASKEETIKNLKMILHALER